MSNTYLTVSVIIPTYNRASLVCQAVDSLLSQTRIPDEIIVVDDGSTDETPAVLQTYDAQVIVIRNPQKERSNARNVGLAHATGDLVAFLDDDDTLTPQSIEIRAAFLEQNASFDVVYGDILMTDFNGTEQGFYSVKTGIAAPSGNVFAAFAERNRRPIHAFMFRRNILDKTGVFNPALTCLEDYHFWLRVAMHSQFHYLDEVVGVYRFHPNQTTTLQRRRMSEAEVAVREELFDTPAFAALSPVQKAHAYTIQGTQYAQFGDMTPVRKWYGLSIRTAPAYALPYLLFPLTIFGEPGISAALRFYRSLRRILLALVKPAAKSHG